MKKYLNTLFITTQGAYLNKEGETVVVSVERETKLQIPIHTLSGIVCFGNVMMSPFLMGFCAENGVSISFLSEHGRFLASIHGKTFGNVLLRREQYRRADDLEKSAKISRSIIIAKLINSRSVLQRALRDHSEKIAGDEIESASNRLKFTANNINDGLSLSELRGIEGDSAHIYFNVFDHLIVTNKDEFSFNSRNRRPPLDKVNCLLSFVYTLLMHDIRSALESVGLDSYVGFLHRDRSGRASLALDIMEEFRAYIADRLVLSLINREQVKSSGFLRSETGAILMDDETRKTVLTTYQKRKQDEITHPFINENVAVGLLFYVQALLLSRFLRDDIDGYPPFIWRG